MISREFEGYIARTQGQVVNHKIAVELNWDPDHDPLAVMMICTLDGSITGSGEKEDIVWVFGRELLADGLKSLMPTGRGDVKFRLASVAQVNLVCCLTSPEGHADLMLPVKDIRTFLGETEQHTPLGEEHFDDLIDEFLKEFEA